MGGIGAVAEPLLVIGLLVGGTRINRNPEPVLEITPLQRNINSSKRHISRDAESLRSPTSASSSFVSEDEDDSSSSDGVLHMRARSPKQLPEWRKRTMSIFGLSRQVITPYNGKFRGNVGSRWLERYPFLIEVWYWGLIYWVYQLGRAVSAVFIVEGTVHAARDHALQVIALEQRFHIFWELRIQAFFMQHPLMMTWINRIYSFIHIPGSIAFLIWLFYYTKTSKRQTIESLPTHSRNASTSSSISVTNPHSPDTAITAGPRLFEARRRTMALCNLCAFIIFTIYPCMPPRLLSSDGSQGFSGKMARSYGFVDTVHGVGGEGSVWTQNRFCNQYAAMPSLHFGYSLLIGLTIMSIPLKAAPIPISARKSILLGSLRVRLPSLQRFICLVAGVMYPLTILIAILATANHFILDAVAGACVCGVAWWGNDVLLNLLVLEDWFFSVVRISRPVKYEIVEFVGEGDFGLSRSKGGFVE